ncbi:hypothetical protein [Methanobrevibacter ruminantium]|uniref:hypothetical protein n=1 Tax=Methanobrevibacter ruminantium TaxID=83816 RepID=UPI0026E9F58F|nr:hypothetical protein [Methanobrevibacter ruminantium]
MLLFSILLLASSVSADEMISYDNIEDDGLIDNQLSLDEDSLEVIDSVEDENLAESSKEISDEEVGASSIPADSNSKDTLSESVTSDYGNQVSIPDITTYENNNLIIKINNSYEYDDYVYYTLKLLDSDDVVLDDRDGFLPCNEIVELDLGKFAPGDYKLIFEDADGLVCTSNIKVLEHIVKAKITASNYTSYYKSGKTVNIKAVDSYNNKPLSLKVKLVFKKNNGKTYTYYVTTNSSGVAKFKVNLAWGTYKLTVSSANSEISSNKASSTVKISKMPIKITVPNYSSYYKSGKKLSIKVINKKTNKGVSVKLKFVYKKPKAKSKVYYVTTNSKGIAKIKIPVGIGKYKLTVKPTISSFKANKVSKKVNVNKYITLKYGKYTAKIHYAKYIKLKKVYNMDENVDEFLYYFVKSDKYKTIKVPIYKTVKVKKTKWVYKDFLYSEDYWSSDYSHYSTYSYSDSSYWKNGWTYCGSYYNTYNDGHYVKYYETFKKKKTYWDTKKVKTGKYKKVKRRVYLSVEANPGKYGWIQPFYNLNGDRVWFGKYKRFYF